MYDFDKTLCTTDMQEYTFIPNLNMTSKEFWDEANSLAKENKMDGILAYMRVMLERAHFAKKSIRREEFVKLVITFAGETGDVIVQAEIHELAFCLGAYLIYMFYKPKKNIIIDS